MQDGLIDRALRFANGHCRDGLAPTPVPGLTILRETAPTALTYAVANPLVAVVLQGSKRVTIGSSTFDFSAGESLLIATDVPTVSQITRASVAAPYLSLVIDLDPAIVQELVVEMGSAPVDSGAPVRVEPTDAEVADVALRILQLFDRPAALPVLQRQLMRELHFWLLSGRHGAGIRNLGIVDSHAQRIARAIAVIRADYARSIRVERLAETAGMSPSSFHEHFRAITSLTPLQFQKQLRLIEARRMMVSEGSGVSDAAFAVGYESVPQFTREYRRFFGLPPARDMRLARANVRMAA
jgi:AraC-like DNA-binding protein